MGGRATRCLGLTEERRRCPAQAVDGKSYCERHSREMALPSDPFDARRNGSGTVDHLFKRLLLQPSRRVVPDGAKFPVPSSIKNSPTPVLIDQLLRSPNATTRWLCAFTLRKRRELTAIEPLWEVLQHDPAALVRQQAAVALGKIGSSAVLGPLIEGLWHDRDAAVRQACAIAIGNLGYAAAASDLANVLGREHAVFVRWDCILALGQIGDRAVENLLRELSDTERAPIVRSACRDALEEICRRGSKIAST